MVSFALIRIEQIYDIFEIQVINITYYEVYILWYFNIKDLYFSVAPEMLMFSLNVTKIVISKTVRVKGANNKDSMLPLKDVVYSGEFHFTS